MKNKDNKLSIQEGDIAELIINDRKLKIVLVSDIDSNSDHRQISFNSALGRAIIGLTDGDSFDFKTPSGKVSSGIIIRIYRD